MLGESIEERTVLLDDVVDDLGDLRADAARHPGIMDVPVSRGM